MTQQYHLDAQSAFQFQEFASFIRACQIKQQKVLVLAGQLNPLAAEQLEPKMREHMLSSLKSLRDQHANMVLMENLPPQSPSDYDDLTHVNKETQARFTQWLTAVFQQLEPEWKHQP